MGTVPKKKRTLKTTIPDYLLLNNKDYD